MEQRQTCKTSSLSIRVWTFRKISACWSAKGTSGFLYEAQIGKSSKNLKVILSELRNARLSSVESTHVCAKCHLHFI